LKSGSSTDDDAAADSTPDQTSAQTSAEATTDAAEGTLCSEVGVASEDPPPEESEGFDGITIYIVEQPVDDTLVVDPGAGCAIRSTVSGLGRVAGLEDPEELSDELGPPTLMGDLLRDECCEGNSPEPIGTDVTVHGTTAGQCEGFGE
jgi:hypothetical protein